MNQNASNEDDTGDPSRSPTQTPTQNNGPENDVDRFANVVAENQYQRDIANIVKAIAKERLTTVQFQEEIDAPVQIEDFASHVLHRNTDLIRRIRLTLDDIGFDTQQHAAKRHVLLGKRIIRALWDEESANKGIELLANGRRETRDLIYYLASTPTQYQITNGLLTSLATTGPTQENPVTSKHPP